MINILELSLIVLTGTILHIVALEVRLWQFAVKQINILKNKG